MSYSKKCKKIMEEIMASESLRTEKNKIKKVLKHWENKNKIPHSEREVFHNLIDNLSRFASIHEELRKNPLGLEGAPMRLKESKKNSIKMQVVDQLALLEKLGYFEEN